MTSFPSQAEIQVNAPSNPLLPPEIELQIVERLIELHDNPFGPRIGLSRYVCVCSRWQSIIEKRTFHHFTLQLGEDLEIFNSVARPRRRPYIKHILLEVEILDPGDRPRASVTLTLAITSLFDILSPWKNHRLTLELGLISRSEKGASNYYETERNTYSKFLEQASADSITTASGLQREDLRTYLSFPLDPAWLHQPSVLSRLSRTFERAAPVEHLYCQVGFSARLASVEVISHILVRRRYLGIIGAHSLSLIFKAAPCVEVIHIERWSYGWEATDRNCDKDSALLVHDLPPSVKRFSFFEESGTRWRERPESMVLLQSNTDLLKTLANTSRHVEHLAISFAIDAWDFFSNPELDWGFLTSVVLTSDLMVSRSSAKLNALLEMAAKSAKNMLKLQILEIWCYRFEEAGMFRYAKLHRSSKITWRGSWQFDMSSKVEQAWREVCVDPTGELDSLALDIVSVPTKGPQTWSFAFIGPHLKLQDHVFCTR